MDEIVLLGFAIPQEIGRFLVMGTFDSFSLESSTLFPVESMLDSYGGRLVDSHQLCQLGEDGGNDSSGGVRSLQGWSADLNGRCVVCRMASRDQDIGTGSGECV